MLTPYQKQKVVMGSLGIITDWPWTQWGFCFNTFYEFTLTAERSEVNKLTCSPSVLVTCGNSVLFQF